MSTDEINVNKRRDTLYVKIKGDTMTGPLVISPTSGTTALTANKDIILKTGQKIIYDGT